MNAVSRRDSETTFLEAPDVEVYLLWEEVMEKVSLVLWAALPLGARVHYGDVVYGV